MSKKMIHNLAVNYIAFCLMLGETVSYEDAVEMVKASDENSTVIPA